MAFTVADYIVRRLAQQQVDTLFGVPAAYCSPLFDAAIRQGMRTVVTASDLKAGYAADSYARTKGLGAASVAYGVGALSMINAIAGGFVERSPVVVVNGGPTPGALSNLRQFDVVPSHSIGQDATDLSAYKLVTPSAARAGTVAEVPPPVVDAAIASAIRTKRPSYIRINTGIWDSACPMLPGAPGRRQSARRHRKRACRHHRRADPRRAVARDPGRAGDPALRPCRQGRRPDRQARRAMGDRGALQVRWMRRVCRPG